MTEPQDRLILVHHGIKGQKWGVKNGPPYPLDASQKSYSEKRLARVHRAKARGASEETNNEIVSDKDKRSTNKRFQLTDKQKRALKIGAAAAGTALLAYGAYRLIQADKLDSNVFLDSQLLRKTVEAADFDTQIKDDLKKINRGGMFGHAFLRGREVNCTSCSMAYEMRRRGYDVIAGHCSDGRSELQLTQFFKGNAKFNELHGGYSFFKVRPTDEELSNAVDALRSQGNGARGIIAGQFVRGGGHALAYEVHNNKVYFVEGQTGRIYKDAYEAIGQMYLTRYMRTDTLALNNSAVETVRNRTAASWLRESPNNFTLGLLAEYGSVIAISARYAASTDTDKEKPPVNTSRRGDARGGGNSANQKKREGKKS